jgi:carboxyl-terminal processing protease
MLIKSTIQKQFLKPLITTILSCYLTFFSFNSYADFKPVPHEQLTTTVEMQTDLYQTIRYLWKYHYKRLELDDELSSKILNRYLDMLDSNRQYFYAKDIEYFKQYEFKIDDQFKRGNPELGFAIYKVFRERIKERAEFVEKLLENNFDFSLVEYFEIDRSEKAWPNSIEEMNDLWRKRIKNQFLIQSLANTPDADIRKSLINTHNNRYKIIWQNKPEQVFEVFLNAYTQEVGPHTQYMSRLTAENFKIQMSLSLEGIGASLQNEDDFTVIRKIIAGGPADKSGLLNVNDKIIGVGQRSGLIEDVTGWNLMDVVKQIRGRKGSSVFLKVIPEGDLSAAPEIIEIVRDVIQLEDKEAKLEYQTVKDRTFAVIEIPLFYANHSRNNATTSSDVRDLIRKAEKERNISGVIIDLRGNGGGYLTEAINLTGLFIDSGPVVQVQSSTQKSKTLRDTDSGVAYEGPLAVLVDEYSASASEIFAAAIQDYGRGIVIGNKTFGKGTVQTTQPLEDADDSRASSTIKFTIQQFFRINGDSTQIKGVTPDVVLNVGDLSANGEEQLDNALPWTQMSPTRRYSPPEAIDWSELNARHLKRVQYSPAFQFLKAENALQNENLKLKQVPLNKEERRKWAEQREADRLSLLNIYRNSLNLRPVNSESLKDSNRDLPGQDKHWDRVFQKESALIFNDYLDVLTQGSSEGKNIFTSMTKGNKAG